MAKKDYVLLNALKGDLDAIENILGRIYAPNFDLTFHLLDNEEAAKKCMEQVLRNTRDLLLSGDLDGLAPITVATAFTLAELKGKTLNIGCWNEVLGGQSDLQGWVIVTHFALDVQGSELDNLFGLEAGRGDRLVSEFIASSGADDEEWRGVLDEHASSVALPHGLIDQLLDELED